MGSRIDEDDMDIVSWLGTLGLAQYGSSFVDNDIDDATLTLLTDDDLREMGVTSLGHRKRILAAIAKLAGQVEGEALVEPSVSTRLPSILALPLRDYFHEHNPVLKLWHACDVVELSLRLVVIVGVAELRRKGGLTAGLVAELRPRIEEPTLGKWRGMAESVARHLDRGDTVLPELSDLVVDTLLPLLDGTASTRSPASSLSALRNQLAHGGGVTKTVAEGFVHIWHARLEAVFAKLRWFEEVQFVAPGVDGAFGVLRGPKTRIESYHPPQDAVETALRAAFAAGDTVVMVRANEVLRLGPLTSYGLPRSADPEVPPSLEPAPQVFARRGEVRLQLTALGSDEVCVCDADDASLEAFLGLFRLHEKAPALGATRHQVRGFEGDIERDAGRLIGRTDELNHIREVLGRTAEGVVFLFGPAGIGKSYLVARVAAELLDKPPPRTLVLAYRFKAGDDRCSRDRFVQFAVERLEAWDGIQAAETEKKRGPKRAIDRLEDLLGALNGRRVLLILDGIDEVAERDHRFAEVPLTLSAPGVTWFCAARPERGLLDAFAPGRCTHLFPDGVPPMNEGDIRTMLLEKIGPLRKRLLAGDRDCGDRVVNPFVERVALHAAGLPIYVTYVIGDILANRFRALDAGERLPPTLDRYHEELLRRLGVGILHQVLTPMVALIALAREPVSADTLADILARREVILADGQEVDLVKRALAAAESMLRRARTPDGPDGFTVFHQSLREHMQTSAETRATLTIARRHLCALAEQPGASKRHAAPYLFRWGVSHLLDNHERERAASLLTNLSYLMDRLEVLSGPAGAWGVSDDWRLLREHGELEDELAVWERFWRTGEHFLRAGDERWPAHRILFQLALDHAESSPLTTAALGWLAEPGRPTWPRLHLAPGQRQVVLPRTACSAVLEGRSWINACAISANGKVGVSALASESSTKAVAQVWDLDRRICVRRLEGHTDDVLDVALSGDGEVVATASADCTVRVWRRSTGDCLAVLSGHAASVQRTAISEDGSIVLSGAEDGTIRLWDTAVGLEWSCQAVLAGHSGPVTSVACDHAWRWAISGSAGGDVLLWDLKARRLSRTLDVGGAPVWAVAVSADGSTGYSAGEDGRIARWDLETGELAHRFGDLGDSISCLAVCADGRRLLSGCKRRQEREFATDRSLSVWDAERGNCLARLFGHSDDIFDVRVTSHGGMALTASRDYTIRLWDLSLVGSPLEERPRAGYINAVAVNPGGLLGLSANDDEHVSVWDLRTWQRLRDLSGHRLAVDDVAIHPDGRHALSAGEDGTVRLWDLDTGALVRTASHHRNAVDGVAPTLDGARVVTVAGSALQAANSKDRTLWVWDLEAGSGRLLASLGGGEATVRWVNVTADAGVVVSPLDDETLGLWRLNDGKLVGSLPSPGADLAGLAVSPDARLIAAGDDLGGIRVWELASQRCLRSWSGHTTDVRGLAFSADGRLLYSASDDCTLRVWEVGTAELVSVAMFPAWVTAVTVLGAGRRALVGLADGHLRLVDLEGAPEPDEPIVTAVRLWRPHGATQALLNAEKSGPLEGHWDPALSVLCPHCGGRFEPNEAALPRSVHLDPGEPPCLLLPDEAWQEPALHTTCGLCRRPLRLNPFIVDATRD